MSTDAQFHGLSSGTRQRRLHAGAHEDSAATSKRREQQHMARHSQTALLVGLFVLWKAALLLIVLLTPTDEGYDSSTKLFFLTRAKHLEVGQVNASVSADSRPFLPPSPSLLSVIATKLTRWDAIYLMSASWRGYVNEQDWAFSFGYTRLVQWLSNVATITSDEISNVIVHGVLATCACHLISIGILYNLVSLVDSSSQKETALIAAILHIVSPAGVFLLAPYSEAPFAALSFLGQFLYVKSIQSQRTPNTSIRTHLYIIASGVAFGFATTVRTNGLFNGVIFAYDVALCFLQYVPMGHRLRAVKASNDASNSLSIRSIWSTILAGICVGAGFVYPQYVAYLEFCSGNFVHRMPPWCSASLPSIYTSIQARYWNVGLFNYWTISNIPLFLLAAPMLWLLIVTGIAPFQRPPSESLSHQASIYILRRLALPQLTVAMVTLITAHVQIINRMSSGYAPWYIYLASSVVSRSRAVIGDPERVARVMIVYAAVQAVLFAAFLPPA